MMKGSLFSLVAIALLAGCAAHREPPPAPQAEPFRVPHDASTLQAAAANPRAWVGGLVAFEGEIREVRADHGRPLLQLELGGSDTRREAVVLWVARIDPGPPVGVVGDRVRVLGYFADDDSVSLTSAGVFPNEPRMLSFAEVNLTTGRTHHTYEARTQWHEWEQGQWPSSFPGAPVPKTPLEPTGPSAGGGSAPDR